MGSFIEVNDTLQLTTEQGFPASILDLARHQQTPVQLQDVASTIFPFNGKDRPRIYHLDPVRVYLVHNIDGKWLFWGKAVIETQTIQKKLDANGAWLKDQWVTSGAFRIIDVFEPDYQRTFTKRDSPPGLSYFG